MASAEGMQISPEMMKAASSMMANMSPEMMQSMMSMASNRGAAAPGTPAANAASTSRQLPTAGKLGNVGTSNGRHRLEYDFSVDQDLVMFAHFSHL